jgi:hypothetical protein
VIFEIDNGELLVRASAERLSNAEIGRRASVHPTSVGDVMRGHVDGKTLRVIAQVAAALGAHTVRISFEFADESGEQIAA